MGCNAAHNILKGFVYCKTGTFVETGKLSRVEF